jgi:hypothetical protein
MPEPANLSSGVVCTAFARRGKKMGSHLKGVLPNLTPTFFQLSVWEQVLMNL